MNNLYTLFYNKHINEKAVIFGTGPSLLRYDNRFDDDSILIGCNSIVYYNKQLMDYYFIGDGGTKTRGFYSDPKTYINYTPNIAKFIRTPPPYHDDINEYKPPPQNIDHALYYPIDGGEPWKNRPDIYFDKTLETISDCGSIIFEMLQFALICGFKNIYLVGCDATIRNGEDFLDNSIKNKEIDHYDNIRYSWYKFYSFIIENFPYINFYWINPVDILYFNNLYIQ